ncbi:unnamed protein product [Ophioblennius macclurei]
MVSCVFSLVILVIVLLLLIIPKVKKWCVSRRQTRPEFSEYEVMTKKSFQPAAATK